MKRNKIMFVIAIVAILAVLFVACDDGAQPEHTHTYGAWSITTQPTETATGTATRACACGDVETATIANLSDATVWTVETSQDATHTSKGFKVYKSAYGSVTVTIEKTTEHTYGTWTLTKNPTATETGTAKRSCVCGDVDTAVVAKLADASVWTTKTSQDATHESKGYIQYTSVYGTVLVEVPAGQHTYNNWVIKTEPTLTDAGLALSTCVCGHYVEQSIPALTDTTVWTKQHTDATHAAAGSDVYTSVYGTVTIVIPQIAHDFTGEYRDNGDGTHSRKCTGCDAYSTAVEHDFSKKIVDDAHKATDADCTHAATYYYSCECGAVSTELTFESGKAVGHNYSEFKVTKEPTCTETGTADSICSVCGDTQHNTLAALGHKYTDQYEQISFDYGDYGEVYQHAPKCDVCGYVNESDSENHTFDNEHFYVTSGDDVYEVCTKCGFYDSEDPISSLSDWTIKERVVADYNQAGYTIYTDGTRTYRKDFDKLVAPYDGKTYTVFELKIDDNGAFNNYYWSSARVTLNANGEGNGTAFPLDGTTKFTMVDPTTGAVRRIKGSDSYEGYVDFETGIIITTARGLYSNVYMFVPVESGIQSDDINGSVLAGGIATSYTTLCNLQETHTFNILINDEGVLFGVKFEGKDGNVLNSAECENSDYVKVYGKDGTVLGAYQKNTNGVFQETDGKEGTYVDANYGTVVLNGIGGATIGESTGIYSYNADKAVYELYVGTSQADATAYYTFTLTDDGIALTKPMTTITYVTAYGENTIGAEYKSVNTNVKFTLPVLANVAEAGANEFVGWTIAGQDGYVTEYTPNGTDVTFTAVWKVVYVVSIIDGAEGVDHVNVPAEEVIYDKLPVWDIAGNRRFVGWFVDTDADGKYTEGTDLELAEDEKASENITIIAVWSIIPKYVGTYYGYELYGKEVTNNGKSLTIDIDGNMTGYKSGTITSYDATTKKVIWSGGEFYFDNDAKIILGLYSTPNIGSDFYFFSQSMTTTDKIVANYAVYARDSITNQTGYYARFIVAKTALGDNTIVFTFGNKVYSGVEVKDALGNTLDVSSKATNSIDKSATVIVYKDGKSVFARAAAEGKSTIGSSSSSSYLPRELDEYFGTYTCEGQDNLVLDGTGTFTWGAKSGTYTVLNADAKTFDLYVVENGNNVEYYTVTLDGSTYTYEKPMVTVTYTTAITPIEKLETSVQVNKNIEITLPALTNADNMFRGWLIADSETLYNGAYVPTANVDFTAKWNTKYTFKAVYNDGTTADVTKTYGEGDVVDIDTPVWAKHRFDGWFTTSTFDEGTEWKSGTAIATNLTIYAKWSDAEPWYNTYIPVRVYDTNKNGGVSQISINSSFSIDAYGKGSYSSYPFNSDNITVAYADKETGALTITVGTNVYNAFMDMTTGVIVMSCAPNDTTFATVAYLIPVAKVVYADMKNSYWNSGETKVLSYSNGDTSYTAFVNDGKVYFDVTFMDAAENGNAIAAENCYNAKSLYVFGSDGEEIARFGYNGTTMVKTDGNEGVYMDGDTKYVLNGAGLIDIYNQDSTLIGSGTYIANDSTEDYQFDVVLSEKKTSHKLSVDKDTYTVTLFTSNCVKITYMDGENIVKTDESVYKFIKLPLWAEYTVEGYVFRGWYLDGDESQTLVTEYAASGDATFVAKLDPAVTLTIVYGNGIENKTYTFGKGDALVMSKYQPALTNGKVYNKWYILDVNGETKVDFTSNTITENITVYCDWIDAAATTGTYKGFEVYTGWSKTISKSSFDTTLTINADGSFKGKISGTLSSEDSKKMNGAVSFGRYGFVNVEENIVLFAYGSGKDSWSTDLYIVFKDYDSISNVAFSATNTNSKLVAWLTITYSDGTTKNHFIYNNAMYANVSWKSGTNAVSATACSTTNTLMMYDSSNKPFLKKSGSEYLTSDGKEGSYENDDVLGKIIIDGYGTLTVNGKNVSYTLDGDKVTFVVDNAMRVITLNGETYTKMQDGYQGEYTLPDASKLTLDGYGNVTGAAKTYVVSNDQITIYEGETSTTYGLDVEGKQFLGKSKFAGLIFTGTYYDDWDEETTPIRIEFGDSSTISGTLYKDNGTTFYFNFTATINGNEIVFTFTTAIDSAAPGKTLIGTINGNTITFSKGTYDSNTYRFYQEGSVSCADYNG